MTAVLVGYQTKFVAGIFVIVATLDNFLVNQFWWYWSNDFVFDLMKFDFFQCLSSIGGVMQLLINGESLLMSHFHIWPCFLACSHSWLDLHLVYMKRGNFLGTLGS